MTKIPGCSMIYQPAGRALEDADLAVNLFRGCNHSCVYCYAPSVLGMKKNDFHAQVQVRDNILKKLTHDARVLKARGEKRKVLLCFTCDPFPDDDYACFVTGEAIKNLKHFGLNVQVLTKGGMLAWGFAGHWFTSSDAFASTLTFASNNSPWRKWEPRAASPVNRLEAIQAFSEAGVPTWVSLEPVIDPAASLEIIRITYPYVNLYKVGKLNYPGRLPSEFRQQVEGVDWARFARDVVELLESLDKPYLIKEDLKTYLGCSGCGVC